LEGSPLERRVASHGFWGGSSAHVLVKVDATVGKLSERSLLLELGRFFGILSGQSLVS
jgi:hypothetical protein